MARHGKAFKGDVIPFGSEVFFRAPSTGRFGRHKKKWLSRNAGVFLGDELKFGCQFNPVYMVMPVDAFDQQSLLVTDTTVWKSDVVYVDRVEQAAVFFLVGIYQLIFL